MSQTKVVQKIKTHILCPANFFSKIVPFRDKVEKYGGVRHATNDKMALAHCMLDT